MIATERRTGQTDRFARRGHPAIRKWHASVLPGPTSMVRAKNEPENVKGDPIPKTTVPFGATSVPSKRVLRMVLPLVARPRKIGWIALPVVARIDELKMQRVLHEDPRGRRGPDGHTGVDGEGLEEVVPRRQHQRAAVDGPRDV